jgi:hypothetical protein
MGPATPFLVAFGALDWSVGLTLGFVALAGVLLLGAHQADEAGRRRTGLVLLIGAITSLVAAVEGPLTILGILFIALVYAVFLGLPALLIVLGVRRYRRRGRGRSAPPN